MINAIRKRLATMLERMAAALRKSIGGGGGPGDGG